VLNHLFLTVSRFFGFYKVADGILVLIIIAILGHF
jgi:hypothetical protein